MVGWSVEGLRAALRTVTVEPVMLVDGACKEAMLLFIENVQMNRICTVNLGYPSEVCGNLTNHPEQSAAVQRQFSLFTFYNSIILSVLPLIYVLFMGAWSDKYGRKIPLLITLVGHVMYAGGYLLVNWQTSWPVETLYLVTLLEALGGTNSGLLSSTISYISDVSRSEQRTSRLSVANSVWFLGGPLGTLVGSLIIKYSGYNLALALVFVAYVAAVAYVVLVIKESHGPFAKKALQAQGSLPLEATQNQEKVTLAHMVADFFSWRRVLESFKTAFKRREGSARAVLITVLAANMIRRAARGFFMYMFLRRVLYWEATDYGYWVTYRNLIAALGSLFLVPFLTKVLSVSDSVLVMVGAGSLMAEYAFYGLVQGPSWAVLMWLGPLAGLVSNACVIALKSISTKLVTASEKGRVTAVMAALNGLMPMAGYALYSPLYYHTLDSLPSAQFVLGASMNLFIIIAFGAIGLLQATSSYSSSDLETGGGSEGRGVFEDLKRRSFVTLKSISRTLSGPQTAPKITQTFNAILRSPVSLSSILENSEEKVPCSSLKTVGGESRGITCIWDDVEVEKTSSDSQSNPNQVSRRRSIGERQFMAGVGGGGGGSIYQNSLSDRNIMATEEPTSHQDLPLDNHPIKDPSTAPNRVLRRSLSFRPETLQ